MITMRMHVSTDKVVDTAELVGVHSKDDAYEAYSRFDVGALMQMPDDRRAEVCKELIKQFEDVKVKPLPLWQEVLDNPKVYEQLAQDHEDGLI